MLKTTFKDDIYKIDKNRGLTKESLVEDYGVRILRNLKEWDDKADYASNTINYQISSFKKRKGKR
jgi:hypothetical protein